MRITSKASSVFERCMHLHIDTLRCSLQSVFIPSDKLLNKKRVKSQKYSFSSKNTHLKRVSRLHIPSRYSCCFTQHRHS